MPKLDLSKLPVQNRTGYLEPYRAEVAGRSWREYPDIDQYWSKATGYVRPSER